MYTNNGFNPRPEVRISFNRDWEEFTVKNSEGTYHTTDAEDALVTAQHIASTTRRKLVVSSSAKSRINKVIKATSSI